MPRTNTPVQYTNVDPATWAFQNPIDGRAGRGKSIYVNSSPTTRNNIIIQLPKCRVPFGIREPLEQKGEGTRRNMEISIEDSQLEQLLHRVDQVNLDVLESKAEKCFGRRKSRETLTDMYRHVIQPGKGEYAPLMRTKICVGRAADSGSSNASRRQTNVWVVQKESESGELLEYSVGTLDDVQPHSIVMPVVEVGGLWVVNAMCGMSFVVTDLMVWPQEDASVFPFQLATAVAPRQVARQQLEHEFDPIDLETTVVNMLPVNANDNNNEQHQQEDNQMAD
jgi:hypothetical protein